MNTGLFKKFYASLRNMCITEHFYCGNTLPLLIKL